MRVCVDFAVMVANGREKYHHHICYGLVIDDSYES